MSLADRARTTLAAALGALASRQSDSASPGGLLPATIGPSTLTDAVAASWTVERPKRAEHGDFATNVAMVLTKKVGMPPRALAEKLIEALKTNGQKVITSAEIAGPGFLNLRVDPSAYHDELRSILAAGEAYGRAPSGLPTSERVLLEFVSANPTGPINVASGRNAIYGDTVGRLLEATGSRVTREYYINDFGNQIRLFAESVLLTSKGEDVGEDGYRGAYIGELAQALKTNEPEVLGGDTDALARTCITLMLSGIPGSKELPGIRKSLAEIGVFFDSYFSEESLHRWGRVREALRRLETGGFLVQKDNALFFVAGGKDESAEKPVEDKERVVRKSDGAYTYFASDIAYHADKVDRGYDRLITVLGADHHGYVARVTNALEALGLPSSKFEALLYQLVYIYKNGEVVKSSKRAGNFVTVEEVIQEIDEAAGRQGAGKDALRFFFNSRSANINIEFDLDLAKKSSLDNPVFYVQYGHARLSSILRKAEEIGMGDLVWDKGTSSLGPLNLAGLVHADELALVHRLSEFPQMVNEAAAAREPHRVTTYLQTLAREFQSYFTRLKTDPILPPASVRANADWRATWDLDKTAARLAWIAGIRSVYAAALTLLGVSAPDRMDLPASDAAGHDATDATSKTDQEDDA